MTRSNRHTVRNAITLRFLQTVFAIQGVPHSVAQVLQVRFAGGLGVEFRDLPGALLSLLTEHCVCIPII